MEKIVLACDIDNTLIYSRKHPHDGWPCVERIHGEEQAYMSPGTCELLETVSKQVRFIPVTSRSVEQYSRISWPGQWIPECAVTTHGAKLFIRGEEDGQWQTETEELVAPWRDELRRMETLLAPDPSYIRCRTVDDAYLFVYCASGTDPEAVGRKFREMTDLTICIGGKKIYLLPPQMNKGNAVERLRQRFPKHTVIAAGDSEMDLDMLNAADYALFPEGIAGRVNVPGNCCPKETLLSEFVLKTLQTRCDAVKSDSDDETDLP